MTNRTDTPAPKAPDGNGTLKITSKPGIDPATTLARAAIRPSVRAAITARAYSTHFGELDLTTLADELAGQIAAVNRGEMRRAEGMLVAQAHTLEAIFHEMVRRAGLNLGEHLGAAETYMRLGLKAQSQCRATLETLAAIKNPAPVTFVRQANVAHGPQQVNNGAQSPTEASRARESENQPNKLLDERHGERLDSGTAKAPVGENSPLAAVGEVHGAKDTGG
jgi:hypothetical protein